jgi:hypothetical protein
MARLYYQSLARGMYLDIIGRLKYIDYGAYLFSYGPETLQGLCPEIAARQSPNASSILLIASARVRAIQPIAQSRGSSN